MESVDNLINIKQGKIQMPYIVRVTQQTHELKTT